ncbi:MAG: hypothetical protein ACFB22_10205 [Rhodothalassiaceae bacterium]
MQALFFHTLLSLTGRRAKSQHMRLLLLFPLALLLSACATGEWPRLADPLPPVAERNQPLLELATPSPPGRALAGLEPPAEVRAQVAQDRKAYAQIADGDRLGAQMLLTRLSHAAATLARLADLSDDASLAIQARDLGQFVRNERLSRLAAR